jgi:hypothetical protein
MNNDNKHASSQPIPNKDNAGKDAQHGSQNDKQRNGPGQNGKPAKTGNESEQKKADGQGPDKS